MARKLLLARGSTSPHTGRKIGESLLDVSSLGVYTGSLPLFSQTDEAPFLFFFIQQPRMIMASKGKKTRLGMKYPSFWKFGLGVPQSIDHNTHPNPSPFISFTNISGLNSNLEVLHYHFRFIKPYMFLLNFLSIF